jgi:hypothetical protein
MSLCKYYERNDVVFQKTLDETQAQTGGEPVYVPAKVHKRRCDLCCQYLSIGEDLVSKFLWCKHPKNFHVMEVF